MKIGNRAVIESTDGAGKSTAAQEAAVMLSDSYRSNRINIVDSTGLYKYLGGELIEYRWPRLEDLEPHQTTSRIIAAGKLGMFTLARRAVETYATRNSDILIGVRDPFRIDPATYALVLGPKSFNKLSTDARLRLFNSLTWAPHPEVMVHLQSSVDNVRLVAGPTGHLDSHETTEKLRIVAEELPLVLEGYSRLYGSKLSEVQALRPTTSDEVAAQIEPLATVPFTSVAIPALPTVLQ